MKNNDLKGYNRALDDITDELEGTQLEVLSTNKDILRIQYLKQVRSHPWLKYHMATWETLPEEEQTYEWLRKTVQRVIDEHQITENDKVWEPKINNNYVAYDASIGRSQRKHPTQGICPNWKKHGRCNKTDCPYDHPGATSQSRGAPRPTSRYHNT